MDNNKDYLTSHLFNYIGNKRKLLEFINENIEEIKNKLGKKLITSMDGFSGSGSVARLLKLHSNKLYVNDLEKYSYAINDAYLSSPSEKDIKEIEKYINQINNIKEEEYIKKNISNYYSPLDDNNIQKDERTFYTNQNSQIIDTIRNKLDSIPEKYRKYILAQLLIKSSIHANTSGVFKGFYKCSTTNIGKFGGNAENCLERIKGKIILEKPIFSNQKHKTEIKLYKKDINQLINEIDEEVDIAYFDPPYNGHPYGSNYFMLNLIIDNPDNYHEKKISKVSGIPVDWNKSNYNYKSKAKKSFEKLIVDTKAKYIMISYNDEGIIKGEEWTSFLDDLNKKYNYTWEKKVKKYNAFRASRNLENRKKYVDEIIWIINKTNKNNYIQIEEKIEEEINYEKMKMKDLIKICKDKGYKKYSLLKKKELINFIKNNGQIINQNNYEIDILKLNINIKLKKIKNLQINGSSFINKYIKENIDNNNLIITETNFKKLQKFKQEILDKIEIN